MKLVSLVSDRPQNKNLRRGGPGRPKGSKALRKQDLQAVASGLIATPEYQASLRKRLLAGKAPHMEVLLHHYLYGKPKERIEHSGSVDLVHILMERLTAAKQKALAARDRRVDEIFQGSHTNGNHWPHACGSRNPVTIELGTPRNSLIMPLFARNDDADRRLRASFSPDLPVVSGLVEARVRPC